MLKKSVPKIFKTYIAVALVVLLAACVNPADVNERIMADQDRANAALTKIEPRRAVHQPLTVNNTPWYGARAIPIENASPLPPRFMGNDGVVLTFVQPMTLVETARMIQAATGVRVSVRQAPIEGNANEDNVQRFLPVDGVEVADRRFVWSGPLPALLAQIDDTFDASWTFDGNMITISDELTRTFMLHALSETIDFNGSVNNRSSQTGAIPEVGLSTEASLEIWGDIEDTVDSIIQGAGRATFSPTTGTITITGKPSVVKKAENYLRNQNKMRLRRVAVGIKVLTVETSDTNSVSFNLNALLERALNGRPFQFTSAGNGLTAGILRTLPLIDPVGGFPAVAGVTPDSDEVATLIESSEEVNRVSLSNSGAVVTLSDIPAPLQIGRTIAYLERITSTTGDDGNISLEPGEINIGLTMNVLPRVIQKDKVLLKLAVGITDAQTPFQEINVGDLRIQLPEIATTGFLQNAVLSKGEMLVLAGFERNQASLKDEGTPGGLFTGGSRAVGRSREVTVLLITADVLPEDPMTVMGE